VKIPNSPAAVMTEKVSEGLKQKSI